jgi:hypothetical protein
MKTNKIFRFALTATLICSAFFAQAQKYVAIYENDTYTIIDQKEVDEMLVTQKRTKALPVIVFNIENDAAVNSTSQAKANGAGTRQATTQASTKPGLKNASAQDPSFELLCDCKENFYVRGAANSKDSNCKEACANVAAILKDDMPQIITFFQKEGIEIDYDGKTKKEKAKSKAPKASK